MKTKPPDQPVSKALVRYQVISAYIALPPRRGQRKQVLEQLAARDWPGPDGQPIRVRAETIRAWVRRYAKGGLSALEDKPRPRRGVRVLDDALVDLVVALKREVPERSLDRIVKIVNDFGLAPPGTITRSTLHRVLKARGLSARTPIPKAQDLDRFEAVQPNDLWQSDMLAGPWLPDPERPGKVRRTWLYAFLDDHSRLCLDGRFSFKGDQPALELVFRRALQRWGRPKRVYYDNGAVYRSHHMRQIVASIGIDGIAFTQVKRPMGHGKIEAFNKYVNNAFIAEVKASSITTLDQLNEAWAAWIRLEYNEEVHGETGQTPNFRWHAGQDHVRPVDEEQLRQAFLWREERTADKAGIFSLFGTDYQVGPRLARRRLEVRYDPEDLAQVEIWWEGALAERVRPFHVREHRRAVEIVEVRDADPAKPPTVDFLGQLVKKHQSRQRDAAPSSVRRDDDARVVALLADRLDPEARDDDGVRAWLRRYGPLDHVLLGRTLDQLLADGPADLHPSVYLDAARALQGGPK